MKKFFIALATLFIIALPLGLPAYANAGQTSASSSSATKSVASASHSSSSASAVAHPKPKPTATTSVAAAKPLVRKHRVPVSHASQEANDPDCPLHHCWRNFGAAPYAKSVEEAKTAAMLDRALADAQNAGLSKDGAAKLRQAILHDNPNGTPNSIAPGSHFLMVESRDAPMFDVRVARHPVVIAKNGTPLTGQAIYTIAWVIVDSDGTTWQFDLPLICRNWSLSKLGSTPPPPPPPPPAKTDCAYRVVAMNAGSILHDDIGAVGRMPVDNGCSLAVQPIGSTEFVDMADSQFHQDYGDWCRSCSFEEPIDYLEAHELNGRKFHEYAGFIYRAPANGYVIIRLPRQFAEANDDNLLSIDCLTQNMSKQSKAVVTTYEEFGDYPTGKRAYIVYPVTRLITKTRADGTVVSKEETLADMRQIPEAWQGKRPKYWTFVPR